MGKTRWTGSHVGDNRALGGAAEEMDLGCLAGENDMITVFDDFDDVVNGIDTFAGAGIFEDSSWILTDDPLTGGTGEEITMNDPGDVSEFNPSCLRVFSGTTDDGGGSMQLDHINGAYGTELTEAAFKHLWIPDTQVSTEVLDDTTWTFACRIGLRADETTTGSGAWDSKAYIGWAEAGDTSVMTGTGVVMSTPIITQAEGGPLVGFCIPEDGSINGISQRTVNTTYAEGTNFTLLVAAGGVDGTTANGAAVAGDTMWFDLALRMNITNMSDNAANGSTQFFYRRVNPMVNPGSGPNGLDPWQRHATVLDNQTPNNNVALIPHIEVINGPTSGVDGVFLLDWWAFGTSRRSRISR